MKQKMGIDRIAIGQRLRSLRGEKPIQKVAEDLGVSVAAISMWENGERLPKDDMKISLASYYGTSVQALFYAD